MTLERELPLSRRITLPPFSTLPLEKILLILIKFLFIGLILKGSRAALFPFGDARRSRRLRYSLSKR